MYVFYDGPLSGNICSSVIIGLATATFSSFMLLECITVSVVVLVFCFVSRIGHPVRRGGMSAGRGADAGSRVPSDDGSVGSDGVGVDREDPSSSESILVDILDRFEPYGDVETSASFVGGVLPQQQHRGFFFSPWVA